VGVLAEVPWIATALNRQGALAVVVRHLRNAPPRSLRISRSTLLIGRWVSTATSITAPAARTWPSFSQLPLLTTQMSLADRTVPVCRWRWHPKLRIWEVGIWETVNYFFPIHSWPKTLQMTHVVAMEWSHKLTVMSLSWA